jgi:uncharacterized protein (UPF0218 family)
MRSELKKPLGLLLEGEPHETTDRLGELINQIRPPILATVGDVTSGNIIDAGLHPDIVVVDNRVMRVSVEPLELDDRSKICAQNHPGTIDADAWSALGKAVRLKSGMAVIVEGEEDLLVLPLIVLMPLGSVVIYGQPLKGMVVVEVTEERKTWAEGFMNRMEER